jgi:citrate lyase subunit alpha/citrate CoA-transferase
MREIHDLKKHAEGLARHPEPGRLGKKIVAAVEYRDGTLIDVVRQVRR